MKAVERHRLVGGPFDLEGPGGGVGTRRGGPAFGGAQTTGVQTEGIPPQAEAGRREGDDHDRRHEGEPAPGSQDPAVHGKAFRSSSKWGPSRSVVQSPPQTIAVPCRAAAALKAAAMRG